MSFGGFLRNRGWFDSLCLIGIIAGITKLFMHQGMTLIPEKVSSEIALPIAQLIVTTLVFGIIGWCAQRRIAPGIVPSLGFLQIGIGQILIISYLYVRSGITAAIDQFSGFLIDIDSRDITILVAAYLIFELKNAVTRRELGVALRQRALHWALFFLGLALIAARELPRTIMLSTDPDQHLYFAMRILFHGGIPWHQGAIGPLTFEYPVGFAALVASWVRVGFFEPGSILTVQPLIQSVLGILIVVEAAQKIFVNQKFSFVTTAVALSLFFSILPLTLEGHYFHLEGTGRISSWGVSATVLVVALTTFRSLLPLASLGVAILGAMNPSLPIIPGMLVALRGVVICFDKASLRERLSIFLISGGAGLLLFLEPYYFKLLTGTANTGASASVTTTAAPAAMTPLSASVAWDASIHLLSNPFFGSWGLNILCAVSSIAFVILLIKRRWAEVLILLIPPLAIFFGEYLSPFLLHSVASIKGGYLMGAYFHYAVFQVATLWLMGIAGILLMAWSSRGITALTLCAALYYCTPLLEAQRDKVGIVNMTPRREYCGCCGCVSADDKAVFQFMETQFHQYREAGRPLDHRSVPKVLVPNVPVFMNGEEWLFPVGSARALPYFETFPLAFFYFQGNKEYSFKNYQDNVCKRLDMQWLKDRNIRFVFIPSEGEGCIRRLSDLKQNVVFQSGNAALLRIF